MANQTVRLENTAADPVRDVRDLLMGEHGAQMQLQLANVHALTADIKREVEHHIAIPSDWVVEPIFGTHEPQAR